MTRVAVLQEKHYEDQLRDILDFSVYYLSDIKPSDWVEANRVMSSEVSAVEGPFRYDYTPYLREVIDRLSPNDPARIIAVMKGAQIGFSAGVIESGIGYIISENPGKILLLTGHSDLSEEAMNNIDAMIESCGLRPLIRPNTIKAKNSRTGDTTKRKEFPGGSLIAGSASNHKLLRQRSMRFGFIDDYDAAKKASKESGSTNTMIEQRFASYFEKMKLMLISTPELKATSNIEPAFLKGDQRRFHIQCPHCNEAIALYWSVKLKGGSDKQKAGMTWELDENGKLKEGSVGYICQECGRFFDDSRKSDLIRGGEWRPMAEPSEVGYYSYHISALYAPPGMYDWQFYVRKFIEANPKGQPRKEDLHKAFVNLVLGETYDQQGRENDANAIQSNIRTYKIGTVPEKIAEQDGNGMIMMLTCACDLNGTEDDARLDYEIVAWSETQASYSIKHGSIGTFIPREGAMKVKKDRARWTYKHNKSNSVWPELETVLATIFETDAGRKMKIILTGVDTGHYTSHAYAFIEGTKSNVIGLKGNKEDQYRKFVADTAIFKPALERTKLFLLDVNLIKDNLSDAMRLNWDPDTGEPQPPGFMNYPEPSGGLYLYDNFFKHYQAEHRVIEHKDGDSIASKWVKTDTNQQNHFWDVYVYNIALRDIWAYLVLKLSPLKKGNWADFVALQKNYIKNMQHPGK